MRFFCLLLVVTALGGSQTFTPFTLTEVSQRFDSNGKLTSEAKFLVASDERGSLVSVDLNSDARQERQIINVASHRTILVHPDSKSASDLPYAWVPAGLSSACETRFHSIIDAVVAVDRTPDITYGIATQRISVRTPRGMLMELTVAPSLGCRVVQSTTSMNGRVIGKLVSRDVKIGQPDPQLFQVPSGYKLTHISSCSKDCTQR